jgi:peroxiredoxin
MPNHKTLAAFTGIVVILIVAAITLIKPEQAGKPAPDVTLSLLDGTTPTLASYRGRVVLISFWSVSCRICIAEMPDMNRLHNDLTSRGLSIIGVNMPYDRPDWTVAFVKTQPMLYPASFDLKGETARAFGGVQLTPTTVLIDRDGIIVWKKTGALDFKKLRRRIEELLASQTAGVNTLLPWRAS